MSARSTPQPHTRSGGDPQMGATPAAQLHFCRSQRVHRPGEEPHPPRRPHPAIAPEPHPRHVPTPEVPRACLDRAPRRRSSSRTPTPGTILIISNPSRHGDNDHCLRATGRDQQEQVASCDKSPTCSTDRSTPDEVSWRSSRCLPDGGTMAQRRSTPPARGIEAIDVAISAFGSEVGRKLRTGHGSNEDHIRGPFESLLSAVAEMRALSITMIGETRLPELSLRPDYAVDVDGARVGYVELKRPGHGIPDTWANPSQHDRAQWDKFRLLPNVLYSDGEQFARYNFGKLQGTVARLTPSLDRAGSKLAVVDSAFERTISDFLLWEPERPRSLDELIRLIAALCRLLRDDVAVELGRENAGLSRNRTFTELAADWRQVLFPNLTDAEFADQYSQTVTFALLLARVEGISFQGRAISEIARLLGKQHSLMGRALTVLTDQPEQEHSVALTTMLRVFSAVDWSEFPDDSFAMLYENFLAKYDPALRRRSGVYYTPAPLVSFVTRFVDDVLRTHLGRPLGFAERDVIVVDPAMGTGSFLAEITNTVAATIATEEGAGAVGAQLRSLSDRLIGFENQAAPYAVAELRIHSLLRKRHRADIPVRERRFLADTLDDPDLQLLPLGRMYEALERSRRGANEVKRQEPVMVVIGNPPYVDKVKGTARWIETSRSDMTSPSLSAFRKSGNGRLEYVLSNRYVYFWRWATWKAFDAHPSHPAGIVAFVCSAGFTTGPGFAGMREYLRRTADEGWIVDLTPEGHQPPMSTRFFRGNQQPICVAVFVRRGRPNPSVPARVWRVAVKGTVEEKTESLRILRPGSPIWQECTAGWGDPMRPVKSGAWELMPALSDLMPWVAPGVKPNRAWIYAPAGSILRERWARLISASKADKPALLKETQSTAIDSRVSPVPGMATHSGPLASENGECPTPRRVMHRSFDRKWVLPDARLHHRPSPSLWLTDSARQIYVVEQHAHTLRGGPALFFSALIPDMHCHSGRGGRVLPLYRDAEAKSVNVTPGLLSQIAYHVTSTRHGTETVTAEDLVAYLAAVTAHPEFTERFAREVDQPGIRVPITKDPQLWADAIQIGRKVVWLHAFGERFVDAATGRPQGIPASIGERARVLVSIPDTKGDMPERMIYDETTRTLHVGRGQISPVDPRVWEYHVSGMPVLRHWFGYRKKIPSDKWSSMLDEIVAISWTAEMTTELLRVINILGRCIALEPRQADLLERVLNSPLLMTDEMAAHGVLPVPTSAQRIPKPNRQDSLF